MQEAVAAQRGGLQDYDVVVDISVGADPAPWAAAGATWVLTRFGPYELDERVVRAAIEAGP